MRIYISKKPFFTNCAECKAKKRRNHARFCKSCSKLGDRNPMKDALVSEETRAKISKAGKGISKPRSIEHSQNLSKALRGKKHSASSKRMKGRRIPTREDIQSLYDTGLTLVEVAENLGWSQAYIQIKAVEYQIVLRPRFTESTKKRISNSRKGSKIPIGQKRRLSTTVKKMWQDPEYVKKQMKSRGVKPNRLEARFVKLCESQGWEFKYVGDGELVIGGKSPDFHDGEKGLIEIYGDFWHRDQDPQDRIDFFKKYGYRCLVIWESEINQKQSKVIKKVKAFIRRGSR